jgi:transglutaminase-like putative cysteine protease
MATLLEVVHTTTYRYARPVRFGEHRVMFRPQPRHEMRVLRADLDVTPEHALRWITDSFGNSIAAVTFPAAARELTFVARFVIEHFGAANLELPLAPDAVTYPLEYSAAEQLDLYPFLQPYAADPKGDLKAWAHSFVLEAEGDTRRMLQAMMQAIRRDFTYRARYEEGTQHPLDTIAWKGGTCRDYAHLMLEACRQLGIAARFVSGYLYDPTLDGGTTDAKGTVTGAGSTHAWAEVYLPGAGWVPYDPTNLLTGGTELIRVATTRIPEQAVPLAGSFTGDAADYLGMDVDVQVRKLGDLDEFKMDEALVKAASWLVRRRAA